MKNFLQSFYPMRWYFLFAIGMIGWMAYADYTGWRILSFSNNQQWSASGPGGHK
ncbi:hypothetical protein ACFP1I_11665 [Dyadobacter subterraneus]|uniref:Uncharacterized protein n=1 Tax=Dyadobacter subterraneus TaxID=2773304 RepID=A0ABR9WHD9_9BACT|nr:hypothetical protein [Dyadobacter subterraneus]MBE9463579.1 hypothetical protein [Dyadobacter subterraneus]